MAARTGRSGRLSPTTCICERVSRVSHCPLMRYLHRRLWAVIRDFDTEPVEVLSGIIAAVWGVWMIAVNVFATATSYGWFNRHGPRELWGAGLATVGFTQLA